MYPYWMVNRKLLFPKGSDVMDNEIRKTFLEERRTNGDFISKVSDMLWIRDMSKFADMETNTLHENLQQLDEMADKESTDGGFLKLTKTNEWVSGDSVIAPVNKKLTAKDWQNDSEKRKKLNFLRYDAIKRELLFLTIGIGTGCCAYCLIVFSMEAAVSYAAGVLFSCLYLQLLYYHADNLSREAIPKIFLQKKVKKIGIRSEDLENTLEKIFRGSTMALSSPRLVIPAALYGICILSQHILNNFEFQIVPAMLGFFAYKAAALVQVYRDNEDLRLIFPESEE
ncbi:uncharacterized protein A4U43_C05F110 [Asparagus officinalis]|uniref:CGL160/ATPI domain-containing protein n=1 Tax=Asparagus officinalis TaxID=4686 RepID=A0A5P1EN60_ASPOF|nr:uncharacterized protein LOC109843549 [Asparagus officinalis]ONK67445.1 uncharacterized protein A4U43_C05F110 [Asparagus officinalis]